MLDKNQLSEGRIVLRLTTNITEAIGNHECYTRRVRVATYVIGRQIHVFYSVVCSAMNDHNRIDENKL